MTNQLYWIWLNSICLNSDTLFSKLISAFKNISEIFSADEDKLRSLNFLTEKQISALSDKNLTDAESIFNTCKQEKTGIITYVDKNYPQSLKKIKNPPVLLFIRGIIPDFEKNCFIGTVGTRNIDDYGVRNAYSISYDLAKAGAVVVSGMAKGIDSVCHAAAIEAGGKTISVLGGGIDIIYPAENKFLYNQLLKFGTVISEYPPKMPASRYSFPRRNRIISGISKGVIVIEADEKSGAMITADICVKQGKTLFTLPHDVGEKNGRGPIKLMKNGAVIAVNADDVLSRFYEEYPDTLFKDKIPQRIDEIKISRINSVCKSLKENFLSDIPERKEKPGDAYINEEKTKNPLYKNDKSVYTVKDKLKSEDYFPDDFWKYNKASELKSVSKESKSDIDTAAVVDKNRFEVLNDNQKKICYFLMSEDRSFYPDEMTSLGLSPAEIMSNLTLLEIKRYVIALPGGKYKIM